MSKGDYVRVNSTLFWCKLISNDCVLYFFFFCSSGFWCAIVSIWTRNFYVNKQFFDCFLDSTTVRLYWLRTTRTFIELLWKGLLCVFSNNCWLYEVNEKLVKNLKSLVKSMSIKYCHLLFLAPNWNIYNYNYLFVEIIWFSKLVLARTTTLFLR